MIIDSVKNIKNYKGLDKIYDVLMFIEKTDFSNMPLGKYHIDGDDLFYMVQEYDTKQDENIGYAPISCEKTLVEEKPDNDCTFYSCETTKMLLKDEDFMVLYPNDIHSPGLMNIVPSKCRKVVFKVKI